LTTEPATNKPILAKEAAVATPERFSELFRRVLLGATVVLLTGRMLAPGEDPGLLQVASGSANLVFPLLWLMAAVGLTLWRVWSRGGDWRGGVVETALLVAVGLAFVSAETAGYKHPARLIAWEWLTRFLVVCMVRQLAVSQRDQNALLAVFLAGAVALSVQALYQAMILHAPASATFAEPGAFAAWLALFLPGIGAAAAVCRFDRAPRWLRIVCALMTFLAAGAFTAAALSAYRQAEATTPPLLETWRDTANMIAARPWLGVGAGNFSRTFSLYQGPNVGVSVQSPRNVFLEIPATYGVFTLAVVVLALGAFFVRAARWFKSNESSTDQASIDTGPSAGGRWEYLFGGMFGLVLGFIVHMSIGDRSQMAILKEGWFACFRCVIWLGAFVVFDFLPWTRRVRVAALTLGVAALLLVLCVNPGAGVPAVTVALWAAVALALNALPQSSYPVVNRLALTRILPVFGTAAIALFFLLNVFNPVVSSAENVQSALQSANNYRTAVQEKDLRLLNQHTGDLVGFVRTKILAPLTEAAKDDPDDARVRFLQAKWNLVLWTLHAGAIPDALACARQAEALDPQGRGGPEAEYQIHMEFARQLEASAQQAGAALGPAYRIFLEEARPPLGSAERARIEEAKKKYREAIRSNKKEEINPFESAVQYQEAAHVWERFLPNAPNDADLRYRLAEALYKAWEDGRCRVQAEEALRLDAVAPQPLLTEEQRRKLNTWKDLPVTESAFTH
jgi:O-Antigen ligase